MQQARYNAGSDAEARKPPSTPTRDGRSSQTAAAGRAFLRALANDFATLGLRLRLYLATRRRRAMQSAQDAARRTSFRRSGRRVLRGYAVTFAFLAVLGTIAVSGAMLWAMHDLPLDRPMGESGKPAILLAAANGEPLGRVGPLKVAAAAREDFPEHLVKAVLSIEDRRFYGHFGVDSIGILRALRRNMAAGEIVEGGSTITQQLVKMWLLGNDRTLTRKLREAATAIWLETRLGKDEILTRYLNSVYMGAGAHGVPAAARLYFDKRPSQLTLAEAALLAGLIKAPSQYSPLRNLRLARARAAVVLDAMVDNGVLTPEAAEKAQAHPPMLKPAREATQAGSWFADWAATQATDLTSSSTRSVRLRTTLMPGLQRLAEQVIRETLAAEGGNAGVSQAALVALRADGAVLAMVGGRDYRRSQFNRAVEANRHPGSAFKLFVYLAALRNGFSLHDTIDARPIEIKGWRPENFGERNYGRLSIAEAFTRSINTAAVRLAMQVGLNEVIAAARDLGIDAALSKHPSLALGAAEVSLLDLTGAFASVRAGRTGLEPWGIAAFATDDTSRLRSMGPPAGGQSLGPPGEEMIELLRQVVERGTGRRAALEGFAAGKTGTSQNHRDAWFIGFNEALTVGVWVGNDDNSPMHRVVGGTLPASIWKRFISEATRMLRPDAGPVATLPDAMTPVPLPEALQQRPVATTGSSEAETTGSGGVGTPGSETARAQCDYQACGRTYRSFRASDCTYQPFYGGPRRFCEKGAAEPPPPPVSRASTEARAQTCNVDVCARFYRSFDPTDCTYQPFQGGPRRICDR